MLQELDIYYANQPEPFKSCLLALRHIVLSQDDLITETRKYGVPCFLYKKKMFCFLMLNKKIQKPYVLFVEGKHLDHPDLDMGNRKRMKVLNIDSDLDIPIDIIEPLLQQALNLYRDGIIKIK